MSYKKSYKKSNDENNLEDFTEVELQGKHDLLKAQSMMNWLKNMENLLDLLLSQGRASSAVGGWYNGNQGDRLSSFDLFTLSIS